MTGPGLWLLLGGAFLVTYVWRATGVALGARVNLQSGFFRWISAVAYAMLAGLIARMLVLPLGALAETPTIDRLGAAGIGFLAYFFTRQNVLLGVLAGTAALVALTLLRQ